MAEETPLNPVIVDTGILYALADRKDGWHRRAVKFIDDFQGRMLVPSPVVPETCYLLNSYLGRTAEQALVKALAAGELSLVECTPADLNRGVELLEKYREADIGFVDAAVVAIAERLRIVDILTTDRRHFAAIRPRHTKTFNLLP